MPNAKQADGPALPRILQDHIGGLFGDHDGGGVGIARHQVRHDRGVDHAQALDAANAQPLIDHGKGIVAIRHVDVG